MLARAKINLGLWITGQRPDGFHNIITLFHLVELADSVEIEEGDNLELYCDACPNGPENIAWRAADKLGARVKITVRKAIPVGGGLGGGSSDAACVLRALGKNLDPQKLFEIGAELGSDVGFFLSGFKAALAMGRGDQLQKVESKLRAQLALFVPDKGVSTAWAYKLAAQQGAYTPEDAAEKAASRLVAAVEAGDLDKVAETGYNEFERVVFPHRPELSAAKQVLSEAGAKLAMLSGSGGVVFGLFPPESKPHLAKPQGGTWKFSRLM